MTTEEIEALLAMTPMKALARNLVNVAKAIEESADGNDQAKVRALVANGTTLLSAMSKLNEG